MHHPKVKTLAAIVAMMWVLLSLSGCVQEETVSAVPTGVQVTDIPADDGTNLVIAWRHYKASTAKHYEVYYSLSKDSLETEELFGELEPATRSVQVTSPVEADTASANVRHLDYYLVLDDPSSETPRVHIIKATDENRDSLAQIGEKVLFAEDEVVEPETDERELVFAEGNYYRIQPPNDGDETERMTVEKATLAEDSVGLKIAEGIGSLVFEVGLSQGEKDFRDAGERIAEFDEELTAFFYKYGQKIVAFVTEDKRYTLDFDVVQLFLRGNIEADKQYYYKIVALDGRGGKAVTEIMEFIAVDEPPIPAANTSARWNPERGEVLFGWQGFIPQLREFKDVREYSIHRWTEDDTLFESGEILGTYASDFGAAKIKGDFSEDDMFYIATYDNAGQKSTSEPFGLVVDNFTPPALVDPLNVLDFENDDGSALAVRWGVPEIALDIVVIDPSPKFLKREIPGSYYLVPTPEGHELMHFDPGDTLIPVNALPVAGVEESQLADKFDVTVSYRMFVNDDHDALYARLKLNDGKFDNDFQGIGSFRFEGLEAGEYTFEATLLNSAGKPLDNPEAHVVKTMTIDRPGAFRAERPEDYVRIYRGNAEIIRKDTVWLAGTPGFDPANKFTFAQISIAGIIDRQIRDTFTDSLRDMGEYYYFVRHFGPDGSFADSEVFGPITPESQWFHSQKAMVLVLVILFVAFVNIFLFLARKGRKFYLRPIAGISHLDEALGRATEMGRPILYVLGLTGISDIATLAGLTILGRVAKKSAEFQTRILIPCYDPIVMIVAQETVKTACMDAGRPDIYNEEDVFYAAGSQFSYAAAVAGLMVRHKTAANFYMGMFFAESLILTETGSMTGSIQIAGTDAVTQIPFFITTCDYTLIGEELYAASAYLSQDPLQVGTLKAQDMLKAIYMVVIVLGTVAMTTGFMWFVNLFKIKLEQ
ncbi:MAG TPA: hypothetical protein ENN07_05310 [candidate division Zixibacteria bacterium]|nr:hypothetical protein [candidate division Zixibacteria bacterium]